MSTPKSSPRTKKRVWSRGFKSSIHIPPTVFLVVYDFSISSSKHIPPTFYKNLYRVQSVLNDGVQIQKSVIECLRLETAIAIADLARHYGANVRIYRASEIIV